jgi:hypothetical protein
LDIYITKVRIINYQLYDRIARASGKDKDEPRGVKVMDLEFRGIEFRGIAFRSA